MRDLETLLLLLPRLAVVHVTSVAVVDATIVIDAVTGARVEVLADRSMATVTDWLRTHPGVAADLPTLGSDATGLERDQDAVEAALTLPYHNGRIEGDNQKIKLLKRQTYGRAGYPLLRQRILLS